MWILILFAHASIWSDSDSMALTTATFATESACISAGQNSTKMANGTKKVIKFTCAKVN